MFNKLVIIILYCVFSNKVAEVMYKDLPYNERFQNTSVTLYLSAVIGIILSKTIFMKHPEYKNKEISDSLYYSSLILVAYSTCIGWVYMNNEMKLVLTGIALGMIIYKSY